VPPAPSAAAGHALASEMPLLDAAREALARRDADAAIAAAREHEQRFPMGQLEPQREALLIQALVLGGRDTEARARAARFRHDFPASILLPAIDRALAGADTK
jgi:hypothetical protein